MVSRVTAVQACSVLPGLPYSIAANVAHTDIWNRILLCRLLGEQEPKLSLFPDFPKVEEKDWPSVRSSFVSNLETAYGIATAEPFRHRCKSDEDAKKLLLEIAVHTAYHLGQIYLIKRVLRSAARAQ